MERVYMRREMYISIMMDRKSGGPIIVASSKGGTSIEDIAASTPELIFKVDLDFIGNTTSSTILYIYRFL